MNNEIIEMKIQEHDKTLEEHNGILKEHDGKINDLEKKDIQHEDKIGNLCEKIDKLVTSQNKLFYALLCGMAGILVKIVFFS